jgi:putative RecB family exonuclease
MRLSPSKLSTFLSCGQLYHYKYVEMLPDPSGQAAVNGTAVHAALEALYQMEPAQRTLAAALAHLTHVVETWNDPRSECTPELETCQERVWALFDLEDPTQINCRRTEMDLLVDWYDDHQLRGIIDRVDVEDDGYVIVDYKSGKAPGDGYLDEKTLGIKMYALMGLKAFGALPVRVKLLYLGTPQTITMDVTPNMVRGVEMKAVASVEAMEAGTFTPKPGMACRFCNYKDVCPAGPKKPLTGSKRKRKVKP